MMKSLKNTAMRLCAQLCEEAAGAGLITTRQSAEQSSDMGFTNVPSASAKSEQVINSSITSSPLLDQKGFPPGIPSYNVSMSDLAGFRSSAPSVTIPKQEEKPKEERRSDEVGRPQGLKYDQGKLRVSLLQGRALEQVMRVAEMGAIKYGDHNYRHGLPVSKYANAAFGHIFLEWLFKGVDNDPEGGLPHLAHGAWNVLTALEQMMIKPELDDRFKENK
jgi:hypothetical protein